MSTRQAKQTKRQRQRQEEQSKTPSSGELLSVAGGSTACDVLPNKAFSGDRSRGSSPGFIEDGAKRQLDVGAGAAIKSSSIKKIVDSCECLTTELNNNVLLAPPLPTSDSAATVTETESKMSSRIDTRPSGATNPSSLTAESLEKTTSGDSVALSSTLVSNLTLSVDKQASTLTTRAADTPSYSSIFSARTYRDSQSPSLSQKLQRQDRATSPVRQQAYQSITTPLAQRGTSGGTSTTKATTPMATATTAPTTTSTATTKPSTPLTGSAVIKNTDILERYTKRTLFSEFSSAPGSSSLQQLGLVGSSSPDSGDKDNKQQPRQPQRRLPFDVGTVGSMVSSSSTGRRLSRAHADEEHELVGGQREEDEEEDEIDERIPFKNSSTVLETVATPASIMAALARGSHNGGSANIAKADATKCPPAKKATKQQLNLLTKTQPGKFVDDEPSAVNVSEADKQLPVQLSRHHTKISFSDSRPPSFSNVVSVPQSPGGARTVEHWAGAHATGKRGSNVNLSQHNQHQQHLHQHSRQENQSPVDNSSQDHNLRNSQQFQSNVSGCAQCDCSSCLKKHKAPKMEGLNHQIRGGEPIYFIDRKYMRTKYMHLILKSIILVLLMLLLLILCITFIAASHYLPQMMDKVINVSRSFNVTIAG